MLVVSASPSNVTNEFAVVASCVTFTMTLFAVVCDSEMDDTATFDVVLLILMVPVNVTVGGIRIVTGIGIPTTEFVVLVLNP